MSTQSLKQKTISGIIWSFSDSFVTQFVQFVVGLILARLLSPSEFGLIGMTTVFLALTQSLVDSGFSQALIRKKDADDKDFSTVFYFNFLIGFLLSATFYFVAPAIARFYKEPDLESIAQALGVIILINAASITQRVILTKRVDFKLQMKINFVAAIISGIAGIILAFKGFGVWSLVWRSIIGNTIQSILLWSFNKWLPQLIFSWASFRELFGFGSKLLISGLLDTLYRNVYLLIIGKYFSAQDLGFYTRADQFNKLPSQNITGTVQRVSYPVLSKLQDDDERLKAGYKNIISTTMFISFFAMLGMGAMSKPLIIVLIGEKWLQSADYLQILCIGGMLYPLHSLNLNILNVKGRSDLFLRLEIIKKILLVPVIVFGVFAGIKIMLIGMVVFSFFVYYINSYYSGKLINYPVREQISDILPTLLLALCVSAIVLSISYLIRLDYILLLLIQIFVFVILTLLLSEIFKLKAYFEIKGIIIDKVPFLNTLSNGKIK